MDETYPTPGKKLPHPAARAPRIFADTATITDIEPLYKAGIISGVTTNPTLMKKAGAKSWSDAVKISKDLLKLVHPNPVNLELTELTEKNMIAQARESFSRWTGRTFDPVTMYAHVEAFLESEEPGGYEE